MARDFPETFNPTVPIDRVAARVVRKGNHHEFKKKEQDRETWDIPPTVQRCVPEQIKALFGE